MCLWERAKNTCMRGNSGCVLIPVWGILGSTYVWLGLCHPRGRRCEHGGEHGPFRVANKASVGDLSNTRLVFWFLVAGVFITVVLDTVCSTDTILYFI
jgi:hypothetical protein